VISNGFPEMPVREITTTPLSESRMPAAILLVIFSFRNSVAKIIVNMGMVAIIRLAVEADMYCSP
jgi:hypothetical protein